MYTYIIECMNDIYQSFFLQVIHSSFPLFVLSFICLAVMYFLSIELPIHDIIRSCWSNTPQILQPFRHHWANDSVCTLVPRNELQPCIQLFKGQCCSWTSCLTVVLFFVDVVAANAARYRVWLQLLSPPSPRASPGSNGGVMDEHVVPVSGSIPLSLSPRFPVPQCFFFFLVAAVLIESQDIPLFLLLLSFSLSFSHYEMAWWGGCVRRGTPVSSIRL